ncbi:hypothetical protein EJI00_00425 [Variovorax sp. DXTD-1]|nr:hypothetical protein EJI00_00425 [Variovorax sp. DXTD-1]
MPLSFLYRLKHVQLPVRVVEREELLHVSVLLATGLIEAEITTLKPGAPYVPLRLAIVIGITENGHAELAKMSEVAVPVSTSMQFSRGFRLM